MEIQQSCNEFFSWLPDFIGYVEYGTPRLTSEHFCRTFTLPSELHSQNEDTLYHMISRTRWGIFPSPPDHVLYKCDAAPFGHTGLNCCNTLLGFEAFPIAKIKSDVKYYILFENHKEKLKWALII